MKVDILVNNRVVDFYHHNGKMFIEGRKGSKYSIRILNDSYSRKKVVVSVDGLNVISGNDEWTKGYILDSYKTITIPGWLQNDAQAAEFVFSDIKQSYNNYNENAQEQNVGVIGVMVFDEVPSYTLGVARGGAPIYAYSWNFVPSAETASGIPASSMMRSSNYNANFSSTQVVPNNLAGEADATCSLGTGWGNTTDFATTETFFNAKEAPSKTFVIFYDSRKGLERRGIVLNKVIAEPNPFPGYHSGYCPPPKKMVKR